MKLTKLIFDYWKVWMRQPKGCHVHTDGIWFYANAEKPPYVSVQFWWVLNIGWYKMNNKSLAYRWSTDKFVCPEDFEGLV